MTNQKSKLKPLPKLDAAVRFEEIAPDVGVDEDGKAFGPGLDAVVPQSGTPTKKAMATKPKPKRRLG